MSEAYKFARPGDMLPYFFICESVFSPWEPFSVKLGSMTINAGSLLRLDSTGIKRMVLQLYSETEASIGGNKVDTLGESLIGSIADAILPGKFVEYASTGHKGWLLVWHGLLTDAVSVKAVEYKFDKMPADRGPFGQAQDPLPNVMLWRNPKIKWSTGKGGQSKPYACAWYDAQKNSLVKMETQPKDEALNQLIRK